MNSALIFSGGGVLVGMSLAACSVGTNYRPPQVSVPAKYATPGTAGACSTKEIAHWWRGFRDPELTRLVERAVENNLTIAEARSRLRESRALSAAATAAWYPQLGASGSVTRLQNSEHSPEGRSALLAGDSIRTNAFASTGFLSWELDVFGGTRRKVEAAKAQTEEAMEQLAGARVSVAAEVALSYYELRGAQQRSEVARKNLATQQDTLAIAKDRYKAGIGSELDAIRAEAQAAATQATIPPLEEAALRAANRIAVLTGDTPEALRPRLLAGKELPVAPPRIPSGLPSDLLRQRPDVRAAERHLAAETARIGVETANLFPKFTINGAGGLQSIDTGTFLQGASKLWSIGPSVSWPIFTAGRLQREVDAQRARADQAADHFRQTVLTSLAETEDALASVAKSRERLRSLAASQDASRRALDLARSKFQGGLEDFLSVLEAQRNLLLIEEEVVSGHQAEGEAAVRLYRSLGGGWTTASR